MTLKDTVKVQIYLRPESFTDLINYRLGGIEAIELNEKNTRNGRWHHRVLYDGKLFVTDTEREIYDL